MGFPILLKLLILSFTYFVKYIVCIPSNPKFMAPKVNKGKNVVGTSSFTPINALSLLRRSCVADFEKSFRNRIVMKQDVNNPAVAAELHIPKIVDLTNYQEINNILKVSTDYDENLIRIFYDGLESRCGCSFCFKMGKNSYHFMEDT